MSRRIELRSPLKDKTLRNPGQSVDAEISRAVDKFMEDGMLVLWLGLLLGIELLQWLVNIPAWMMVSVTVVLLIVALTLYVPRMIRGRKEIQRLRRARDGERAVAECLDLLRDDGHRVFHDIVGPKFNIDHVVIGPKGVFTVETKTLNKHAGRDDRLHFDGEGVRIGEVELPVNPIPQARAQASWFKRTLFDSTSKMFGVKPVVVFPGWFVEWTPGAKESDTWVLEPKALQKFLKNEPDRLKAEDISLAVFHLKRYIRASDA